MFFACFLHVFCIFSRKIAFCPKNQQHLHKLSPKHAKNMQKTCKKHWVFSILRCLGLIFQPPPKLHVFCIFSRKIAFFPKNQQHLHKLSPKHAKNMQKNIGFFQFLRCLGLIFQPPPKLHVFCMFFAYFRGKLHFFQKISSIYTNYPQNMQKTCKKHAKNIGFFQFLRCLGLIFQPPPKLHVFCMFFAYFRGKLHFFQKISSIYTNYPQNMQKTCKKHAKSIGFFQFLRCLGLIFQPPPKVACFLHVFCMLKTLPGFTPKHAKNMQNYMQKTCKKHWVFFNF